MPEIDFSHPFPSTIYIFDDLINVAFLNGISVLSNAPLIVYAFDSDDRINIGGDANQVAFGGQGKDELAAAFGCDQLFGEDGNDVLFAHQGNGLDALFEKMKHRARLGAMRRRMCLDTIGNLQYSPLPLNKYGYQNTSISVNHAMPGDRLK